MLRVMVQLDRSPLRYTFVSHRPDFADPVTAMTDATGTAQFDIPKSSKVDLFVHAHNLAVRMLDGTDPGVSEVALRFRNKSDGSRLNITPANKRHFPHYQVMDGCYRVYETVFAHIPPFSGPTRREFPFGGRDDAAHEHRRSSRVDCRFPETLVPGKLPWVQPQSVTCQVPLMHLKGPNQDRRLFGSAKRPATTLAHEYAHAIHFALLPNLKRWELAAKYALWIGAELANGNSGTHRTDKKTSPLIAHIESIGIFAQRFWTFATRVEPGLRGAELRAAFVADELGVSPSLADVLPGYRQIATRTSSGRIRPKLTGASTEGAVYGALFLDLADRIDLATVVNWYLRSRAFTADSYLGYASKSRRARHAEAIDSVSKTWRI